MIQKGLNDITKDDARRREKAPLIGRVSKVFEKETNDLEEGNIEVNVQTVQYDHEFRRVPVIATDHGGHTVVPQVGDHVMVQFTSGRGKEPMVVGASTTDKDRAPHARAGHWRHEWGNDEEKLYLEAEPKDGEAGTPELLRLGIKDNGLADPTTEVVVDNSGDETKVRIESDGNVSIDADTVVIQGEAFLEHTHEFTNADGTTDETSGVSE